MEEARWISFTLADRQCFCAQVGTPTGQSPLVLLPAEMSFPEQWPGILSALQALGPLPDFAVAGFLCDDWNRDLSPWPAPALFRKTKDFAGLGPETLTFLMEELLPALAPHTSAGGDPAGRSLLGYSLAGLFALWAFLETGAFARCASCSGSLWYDGWPEYVHRHADAYGTKVYLSLGKNEEKTRNPRMARVGEATRQTAESLGVSHVHWHEGGHFDQVSARLAGGLRFLVTP